MSKPDTVTITRAEYTALCLSAENHMPVSKLAGWFNHWKTWGSKKPKAPVAPMAASSHHPLCSVQNGGSCDYDCGRDYNPTPAPRDVGSEMEYRA